ncbi:hypothetical protein AAU57_05765 [Nonlabens sp. YIK11]|uniref:hypothetical protein n=1 Tax=Nonlabens sp. YIK11 TaxID=1453349 RepID=UPI0006DC6C5B|nr:hypothetical protein [Nonlabens sp. YIK11]KQC32875.1 hypothetical protein AAU57_05765 [Nonlabens sp. YIK11]
MADSENLYTDDNPETTVEGLGFASKEKAEESVEKVKALLENGEIDQNHAKQICVTMEQRSKHHPHRNDDMKAAEKVWRDYLEQLKSK